MKIAYLIHGHSRTWRECYKSFFDNIFSVAPGDIFFHTWDRINSTTGSYWNGWAPRLEGDLETISSRIVDLNGIVKAYNPKYFIVEKDRGAEFWQNDIKAKHGVYVHATTIVLKNFFHGQKQVFNIAQNFGPYDKYFFTRFDLKYKNKIDINAFNCEDVVVASVDKSKFFLFDIWKIANPSQSAIIANFYDYLETYYLVHNGVKNICGPPAYSPECAVYKYWKDFNLKPHQLNSNDDPKYEIIRISSATS